jgi:hypothetical protein
VTAYLWERAAILAIAIVVARVVGGFMIGLWVAFGLYLAFALGRRLLAPRDPNR